MKNMWYKILRFLGAIAVAIVFAFLVDYLSVLLFKCFVDYLQGLSFEHFFASLLSLSLFGTIAPLVLGLAGAIVGGVGYVLVWLVRGVKWLAITPIIYFVSRIISDVYLLFFRPEQEMQEMINYIGHSSWYYLGAIVTLVVIICCYLACSVAMLFYDENEL